MITDTGLNRPTFTDLKNQRIADLRLLFETTPGTVLNVAPQTPLGHMIDLECKEMADIWDIVEFIFNAIDLDTTTGILLDMVGKLLGMERMAATPPSLDITFYMEADENSGIVPSTTFPALLGVLDLNTGINYVTQSSVFLAQSSMNEVMLQLVQNNSTFSVTLDSEVFTASNTNMIQAATSLVQQINTRSVGKVATVLYKDQDQGWNLLPITEVGDVRIYVQSTTAFNLNSQSALKPLYVGVTAYGLGSTFTSMASEGLTVLSSPASGAWNIQNIRNGQPGAEIENDVDFRARLLQATLSQIDYTEQKILRAVQNVPGVSAVFIQSNRDNITTSGGMPPHSFVVTVSGGNELAIARAIQANAPPGIATWGNWNNGQGVVVSNEFVGSEIIKFSRPQDIYLYIEVRYQFYTDEIVTEAESNERIINEISDWGTSEYTLGRDIIPTRIFTPINRVPGLINVVVRTYVSTMDSTLTYQQIVAMGAAGWSGTVRVVPESSIAKVSSSRIFPMVEA